MRIQELERLVGADRATIRFYEKQELIAPGRSENGYRDYTRQEAEELKKILLLRELGVTIEQIRNLQQGSEDLSEVMNRQAEILTNRSERMENAGAVCRMLSREGIRYDQLDTGKYHEMLTANKRLADAAQSGSSGRFSEPVQEEIHPWKRYFARMIDHDIMSTLMVVVFVVLIRVRPVGDGLMMLIGIGAWCLLIPVEAAFLHYFGTTPGKWIMGIRIVYYTGEKLQFDAAFRRTLHAVTYGVGFGIPLVSFICLVRQYCKLTGRAMRRFQRYDEIQPPMDMEWDEYSLVQYEKYMTWKKIISLAGCIILCLIVAVFSISDSILPKYRGSKLSISQFSANYTFYNDILCSNMARQMYSDGTLYDDELYMAIYLDDYKQVHYDPVGTFQYETEGERLTAITMHHTWYEQGYAGYTNEWLPEDAAARWMSTECELALMTIVASQEGMTGAKITEFQEILEEKQRLDAGDGIIWSYGNITVSWTVTAEPYYESKESNSAVYDVTLDLRIDIG